MLKWNVIGTRPMDEEELECYAETGMDCMLTNTPNDEDEVLLSTGRVDVFLDGGMDGCYWDSGNDVEEDEKWVLLKDVIEEIDRCSASNEKRTEWHDLRKDPHDLPEKDGLYWTYSHFFFQPTPDPDVIGDGEDYTMTHFADGKWEPFDGYYKTLAWREIEPIEEE